MFGQRKTVLLSCTPLGFVSFHDLRMEYSEDNGYAFYPEESHAAESIVRTVILQSSDTSS